MKRNFFITELEDIYLTLKGQEDYKTSLHVLKLLASIQGYLKPSSNLKDKAIDELTDAELESFIEKLEQGGARA